MPPKTSPKEQFWNATILHVDGTPSTQFATGRLHEEVIRIGEKERKMDSCRRRANSKADKEGKETDRTRQRDK